MISDIIVNVPRAVDLIFADANYQMAYGSTSVTEHLFRAGKISINGNINIPTTTSTVGQITQNGNKLIHT